MASHATLGASLLRDAATFFTNVAEQNEALREQMTDNAQVFRSTADLLERDPDMALDGAGQQDAALPDTRISTVAARLLEDAATFFEVVGQQNEPVREQMSDNASVYREIAQRVRADPHGVLRGPD
jgi:hypothetical protein